MTNNFFCSKDEKSRKDEFNKKWKEYIERTESKELLISKGGITNV